MPRVRKFTFRSWRSGAGRWLLPTLGLCLIAGLGVMLFTPKALSVAASHCPQVLEQLDAMISQWASDWSKDSFQQPAAADLGRYFQGGKVPVCHEGGRIIYGTSALATTCSLHGQASLTVEPGRPNRERLSVRGVLRKLGIIRVTVGKSSCWANLKQIDGATQQWALENQVGQTNDVVPPAAELAEFFKNRQLPLCPNGGKYILCPIAKEPRCTLSLPGHTL